MRMFGRKRERERERERDASPTGSALQLTMAREMIRLGVPQRDGRKEVEL